MRDFLSENEPPPYLRLTEYQIEANRIGIENAPLGSTENVEAEVAAGSVLQRVASFNILRSGVQSPRRHVEREVEITNPQPPAEVDHELVPTWRLKDRMKTVGVGLVMALNIGTEPPDITKPHPCAMLQCWMDPSSISRAKAKEQIGERLESQYAQWQQKRAARPMRYRRALDPTVEDVRALCLGLRKQARTERVLLHYNGHGVPRPTENGEIWVFDKNHTQYIPLCVTDLRQWIGKPSIIVLDCSSAGILMPFLTAPLELNDATPSQTPYPSSHSGDDMEVDASQWIRDTIVLSPTSDKEWLPMHPDYPADIFTSCLTTPMKMALRWFVRRNPQSMGGLNPDAVDAIPGNATDRKTPLGDLNWIFTSVTDSIAWNILPKSLFQRLFRQELLVASLFRNFLLADRILRSLNCSPQSFPPFPPGVCDHPLWQAWDLACETCLCGLIREGVLSNHIIEAKQTDPEKDDVVDTATETAPDVKQTVATVTSSSVTSPFFSEQLTAFEIWLEFASIRKNNGIHEPKDSPEQLPIVLQLLLSQAHRERALTLLSQFLDLGPWAVSLSLSLGIFPYVMKLWLSQERKQYLVGIWARIIAFDSSCQVDLVKDGALPHYVQHLTWGLNRATMNLPLNPLEASEQRIMAAFILSAICVGYPQGQVACVRKNLHGTCCTLLSSVEAPPDSKLDPDYLKRTVLAEERVPPKFRLWLCLCLGNLFNTNITTQADGLASGVHLRLYASLQDDAPVVRTAACFAIGCLLSLPPVTEPSHVSPTTPWLQPAMQAFNSVPPSTTVFQENRTLHQQGLTPPLMRPRGNEFSGRLQPNFVPSEGGALAGHPQQLPVNVIFNATTNPDQESGQPNLVRSHRHAQSLPTSAFAGSDRVGGLHSQGQSQAHAQSVEPSITDRISIFEDRRRLTLDLMLTRTVLERVNDANPMVRYEAVLVIARLFDKYLPTLLSALEGRRHAGSEVNDAKGFTDGTSEDESFTDFPFPLNVDHDAAENFRIIWRTLKMTQKLDVHPRVAEVANSIICFVQEKVPRKESNVNRQVLRPEGTRRKSDQDLHRSTSNTGFAAKGERPLHPSKTQLDDVSIVSLTHPVSMSSFSSVEPESQTPMKSTPDATLPVSAFFEWQRDNFFSNERTKLHFDAMDQLSPAGALRTYLRSRNAASKVCCAKIAEYYACLAPKPKTQTRAILNNDMFLEVDESAMNLAEEKLTAKKNSLELKQIGLLSTASAESTSMLRFHPSEDILVVCNDQSGMSVWDTKMLTKGFSISNGNPKGSRFTSTCWMNEEFNSVFVTGCDDGSVRAWGGIPFSRGETNTSPTLLSAFFALPTNVLPGKSGLILEWQQYSGQLFAAGNYSKICSWDMNAEKCCHEMTTDSDACVTTLTTAWSSNAREEGHLNPNSSWTGPNVLVAGFSDGVVKVFDTRTHSALDDSCATLSGNDRHPQRRATTYREHGSWVVETAFIGYNNNYGIVSGSVVGDVKIFDLRSSRSIHSYTAQRSPMTAMAAHIQIPLIATGSHAQFINLMTLDGEAIQVIRHSQLNHGRMIGPVRCLAFHPRHTLLAAGGTDNLVHLFSPKNPLDFYH